MTADNAPRLTSLSHGAGCACKLSPDDLTRVLTMLGPAPDMGDGKLLVGYDTADDAAIYQVRDDLAIAFTADFFTPIVDDPYDWGRIAATNALSDVYAMGAEPLMALNLVAWPRDGLPFELLAEVLRGGRDVASGAGIPVVGGHSIDDAEPKYGMAAVGSVHPDEVIRNAGGHPGDALVLTKALGTGIVSTAIKREAAPPKVVEHTVALMTTLNADAASVARRHEVRGGTDVTGFGLLGHLRELALASGCAAEVDVEAVPVIDGVRDLVLAGMVPGGTRRNLEFIEAGTDWGETDEVDRVVLADAQTSGGLLLCVRPDRVEAVAADLEEAGVPRSAAVGRLTEGTPGSVRVRRRA